MCGSALGSDGSIPRSPHPSTAGTAISPITRLTSMHPSAFPRALLAPSMLLALAAAAAPALALAQTASAEAASAPTDGTLPSVRVQARADTDATTEHSGSYAPSAVSIGKGDLKLREVPHSVTVITRQQLTDQNLVTVEQALKNVTGVTVQRFDATGSYTQFMARGYAADTYQLDGLTVQTDVNGIYFDLAAYDRIEVQRGAASLFSGAGEPGVTVNMARKRAPSMFQAEGAIGLSRWDDRRAELDVGGAFNEAGTLRGRAVAVVQDFDTFMDGIDDNRKRLVYGTLEADVADRTTVSVGTTFQRVDTTLSRGLPTWPGGVLIDMPRSTMPVQSWNAQRLDSASTFAELERRGADESLFKVALRYVRRTNESNYLDPSIPAADGTMSALSASAFDRADIDRTADVYYNQPFSFAGQTHNVLVGADYRESRADTRWAGVVPLTGQTLNLFAVDPDAIPKPVFNMDASVSRVDVTSYGAYTQLRYKPAEAWTLIGGGRLGSWKSSGISYGSPTNFEDTNEFTPYAAVLFDVARATTLYGSFNRIFKPQNAQTADGSQIDPREGNQVELGVKGELDGGRFVYTAAAYRIEDSNRAVADPVNTGKSIASGKVRTQGAEVDVHGELWRRLSVSAGYAYTDTRYLSGATGQADTPYSTFTPRHNYNLWLRYKVDSVPITGLVLGAGLRGMSDFYSGSGTNQVRGPGYTVYSMNAAYPINDHLRVALNVDNLFDKVYWEKVSGPTRQNFFGEPRRVTVALRASY